MNTSANRLRELRENAGITRQELAERSGVSIGALNHYEAGTSDLSTDALCKLADFYGCSADFILGRTSAAFADPGEDPADDLLRRFRDLLQYDNENDRDCSTQYQAIIDELRTVSEAATDLWENMPADPSDDDLAMYYSKLNQAASSAATAIRLIVSLELFPGLVHKRK